MACIAGGIAQAYWGVPSQIEAQTLAILGKPSRRVVDKFTN